MPPKIGSVVGENLRRLRAERSLTQDELGLLLKRNGLAWQRSHVAAIEAGNRESIEFDTAVVLARALGVQLTELIAGDGPVQLTVEHELSRTGVRETASAPPDSWREAPTLSGQAARALIDSMPGGRVSFQADAELAQRLGLRPEDVYQAAERLWGRNLHQERDRRIDEMGEMPTAERRARRGHVTRQLAKELMPHLPVAQGVRPKPTKESR